MRTLALCCSLLPLAAAFIAPAPTAFKVAGAVRARGGVEMMADRSKSLPFLMKPPAVRSSSYSGFSGVSCMSGDSCAARSLHGDLCSRKALI